MKKKLDRLFNKLLKQFNKIESKGEFKREFKIFLHIDEYDVFKNAYKDYYENNPKQ